MLRQVDLWCSCTCAHTYMWGMYNSTQPDTYAGSSSFGSQSQLWSLLITSPVLTSPPKRARKLGVQNGTAPPHASPSQPCAKPRSTFTYPTPPPTLMIFILTTWQGVPWPNYCLETSEGGKHKAKCLMVKRFTSSSKRRGILGWCWSWAGWRTQGFKPQQVDCVIGGQG